MSLKRSWLTNYDPDSFGACKRQAVQQNSSECLLDTQFTAQNCTQDAFPDGLLEHYEAPLIKILDCHGDTNMGNVEVVAGNSSCVSDTASSADTTLAISKAIEYITDQEQEICFGMICYVTTQFLDNPRIFEDVHLITGEGSGQSSHQLKIFARNNFFVLQSLTATEIAVLNSAISHCFQQLSSIASVRYEAFVDHNAWTEALQTWKKSGKRGQLLADVQVYGLRDSAEIVGKVFSRARLYFQHPVYCNGSVIYENPHYLSFSNLDISGPPVLASWSTSEHHIGSSSKCHISEILESLDQQRYLRQANIDPRVQTQLLRHQKQGVDFILQREAGITPPDISLWKLNQQTSNRYFYEHLITGSRRQFVPDSTLGGIISDEMGMGKSLTMLSAILSSLAAAESFGQLRDREITSQAVQKPASKATLILVPSVLLLDGWIEEIQTHILPNTLNIYKYHGPKRESDPLKLLDFDIIFTTYTTVAVEFRQCSNVIHSIKWFRIVLDEAHTIRHQNTRQFRAVSTISSKIRWCLTGTPIQNSLKDLVALVKFLRVPLLETSSTFRDFIISPIESGNSEGFSRLRLLLRSLCLRRTNELLHLPEPIISLRRLDLASAEDEAYVHIGEMYRKEIDRAVSGCKTVEAYNGILQALLRLRLLCNHGTYEHYPQEYGIALSSDAEDTLTLLQQSDYASCTYCSCDVAVIGEPNGIQSAVFTVCSHLLCTECLPQYEAELKETKLGKKAQCPLCENVIVGSFLASKEHSGLKTAAPSSAASVRIDSFNIKHGYSTKLFALLRDVESQLWSDKCIVFSAWKKSLDLVACLFSARKIPFAIINGSLSLPERRKVLSSFKSNPNIKVLLMTLGTGAVGLNLTIATRIHILEPQRNPCLEKQAIGRILRLGQDQQITIIRYIMNGTVEEYIESRQSRKLQLGTVGWEQQGDGENDHKLKELLVCTS